MNLNAFHPTTSDFRQQKSNGITHDTISIQLVTFNILSDRVSGALKKNKYMHQFTAIYMYT